MNFVSKHDECCSQNDEFCIKYDEMCKAALEAKLAEMQAQAGGGGSSVPTGGAAPEPEPEPEDVVYRSKTPAKPSPKSRVSAQAPPRPTITSILGG